MAITASMVKELRELTGVGMLDCKKALAETDGDMEKAVEYLREKGLAASEKKAGRIASEGVCLSLIHILYINIELKSVEKRSNIFCISDSIVFSPLNFIIHHYIKMCIRDRSRT